MAVHPEVAAFRDWLVSEYHADANYERVIVLEGEESRGWDTSVRLDVGKKSYYEVRVDLARAELQVGFSTEGRMINEELEEMVIDNGGDLGELLADELSELGEELFPMAHFFERPAFRFTVKMPLGGPEELAAGVVRRRTVNLLKASRTLFQSAVDEA